MSGAGRPWKTFTTGVGKNIWQRQGRPTPVPGHEGFSYVVFLRGGKMRIDLEYETKLIPKRKVHSIEVGAGEDAAMVVKVELGEWIRGYEAAQAER